jgi:glycosyltransferase involved in cell wall biosynthesis
VLIPTYNRSGMLADVLDGLEAQTLDRGRFEVIVLDDGSTDDTAQVVAGRDGGGLDLRYVRQENAGLNTARNHAAAAATAPLLVYLDDDVLLPPDYVEQMLAAFAAYADAAAVAGRILLRFEADVPPWLTGSLRLYLSEFDRGDNVEVLTAPEYPRGASFGIRRSALDRLGGFVPNLDRRGTSLVSSGEQELFLRLHAAGGQIVYWPRAWVDHRVPPERVTLDYFRRRARAQGVSDALLSDARRQPSTLAREVLRSGRLVPITLKSLARGAGLVNTRLWWEYSRGRIAATWGARS